MEHNIGMRNKTEILTSRAKALHKTEYNGTEYTLTIHLHPLLNRPSGLYAADAHDTGVLYPYGNRTGHNHGDIQRESVRNDQAHRKEARHLA